MQGLAQLMQYIIGNINDIINTSFTNGGKGLPQPFRGWAHLDTPDDDAAIAGTSHGVFYRNPEIDRIRGNT